MVNLINFLILIYFIVNGFVAGYYTHQNLVWCKNKFERTVEIMWIIVLLFFGSLFQAMEFITNFSKNKK